MLLRNVIASSFLVLTSHAMADAIDLNLRDTSAQLMYKAGLGTSNLGKSELNMGVLYTQKNNLLAEIGIQVKDDIGANAPGVSVGMGIKAFSARTKVVNLIPAFGASGVAVGGLVRYSPPVERRLGFVAQVYLSPSILTFGDADRYLETSARVEYEIIPQATVYLGYRNMSFNLKNTNTTARFDEGFHLGMKMMF